MLNRKRGIKMDKKTTIKEFLEFRSRFTKREWHELNQAIDERLKQKADQLELDDLYKNRVDTIIRTAIVDVNVILVVHSICLRFSNW